MSQSILDDIVAHKRKEVEEEKRILPLNVLKARLGHAPALRDFEGSLFGKEGISIIAEIKRMSPSKGALRENLNPSQLARLYEENGASAVSVLVDRKFFGGSLEDVQKIRGAVSLPLLAKEFVIDEYQIYQARYFGADAILLILRLLDQRHVLEFHQLAGELGLSCIMEAHSVEDTEKILQFDFPLIVGVNNRNLENFQVDITTTQRIVESISSFHHIISESGIKNIRDIKLLEKAGAEAFLVGEAIVSCSDPAGKLRELVNGES